MSRSSNMDMDTSLLRRRQKLRSIDVVAKLIQVGQHLDPMCDDEGAPLIFPTCQVLGQSASVPATACYLAWGRFRYFRWEPQLRGGEIGCLKPHTPRGRSARRARSVQMARPTRFE